MSSSIIKDNIYQIGPVFDNDIVAHASYLIVDEKDVILINPGSKYTEEIIYNEIQKIAPHLPISRIIITNPSVTHTSSLPFFATKMKRMHIVTEWRSKLVLESYKLDAKYTLIAKNKYKITLQSGRVLQFIKAPFLPSSGSFLIVDRSSKTLFSSELYSTYSGGLIDFSDETHLESVLQYHEMFFPSSDFVKPVNNVISKLDINHIVTNTGSIYNKDSISKVVLAIFKHEFYNSDFVVRNMPLVNRTYDYINILNQYLLRLYNVFEEEEIVQAFQDSEITVDPDTLQIKDTTLKRRVLYNRFFDILYDKNGIMWLNVLEASVNRVARKYYIQKPDIYKARALELQEKVTVLESDNMELIQRAELLQKALEDTKEQLLKCPLTGLYNKYFFTQFLAQNINDMTAVMMIEVDDLERLNRDYSYDIGNETIQHLHYIIENQLPSDVLLFRGDGSSFLLYFMNQEKDSVLEIATLYRNVVAESNTFIESISVGIGIVFSGEKDQETIDEEWILEQTYQRVNHAHQLGKGEIVYTMVNTDMKTTGALLLVDDDPYNIGVIKRICERENIALYKCFDVYEALEYINSKHIDVIVSEINLSKLDAFYLKTELNKSLTHTNIPFIIASHNKTKDTIIRANALQVDYILSKPFYPEELLGILRRVFHK